MIALIGIQSEVCRMPILCGRLNFVHIYDERKLVFGVGLTV